MQSGRKIFIAAEIARMFAPDLAAL